MMRFSCDAWLAQTAWHCDSRMEAVHKSSDITCSSSRKVFSRIHSREFETICGFLLNSVGNSAV